MKTITLGIALVAVALLAMPPVQAQDLKEKLAAAKQAAALNQKALRSYSWLEKTELSLKGEVKNTKVDMCKYGPDGKVQKTASRGTGASAEKTRAQGQDRREEDRRDEGRARGRRRTRPAVRAALTRLDAGRDERRHGLALTGGSRVRGAEVPWIRQKG